MNVCVYCASSEGIGGDHLRLAADVGARLARDGHGLVSGAGGAHTVGVIPRHLVGFEVADVDADELVVVETMRERKRIMDERSDAFLALPGGIGTLEELFEIWTAHTLGMHAKPVVVLDPGGFYEPLWRYLTALQERGFVRATALDSLRRTSSVDEAFAALTG